MKIWHSTILIFFVSFFCYSQDTLLLITGEKFLLKNYKFDDVNNLILYQDERGKLRELDKSYIFSIKTSYGDEQIYYRQDSSRGNFFSISQMRSYIQGEYTAFTEYKPRGATIMGFIIGAGSVIGVAQAGYNPIYSPLIPGIYATVVNFTFPSYKRTIQLYPWYSSDEYFILGYQEAGQNKRVANTVKGAGIGILIGAITVAIIRFTD